MADPTTTREAARPENGAHHAPTKRPFDPRDAEIARLERERDHLRARERIARAEAEEAQKRLNVLAQSSRRFAASMRGGTSERRRYRHRVGAQYAVSQVLAEARDLREAAPHILQILGEQLGWEVGVLWKVSGETLRCQSIWRSPAFSSESFEEACREASFPRGVGLPGRVWSGDDPVQAESLQEEEPLREAAAEAGLQGAIAFPVRDGGLVGVFELFRTEELDPDDDLLRTVALVGRQVGQFVERRRAEEQRDLSLLRERRARQEVTDILESIHDAFFALGRDRRFTYLNRKAEQLWGKTRAQLVGRNIWEEFPQAVGSDAYRNLEKALEEGVAVGFEAISPVLHSWISARVYPNSGGISVYIQDITERKKAEEAVREAAERDRFRLELTDALGPLEDPIEIQAVAMRVLGEHLRVDRVLYAEIEPDGETVVIADNYVNGVPKLTGRLPSSALEQSSGKLRAGETLVISDVTSEADLAEPDRASFSALGVVSSVGVPLVKGGRWVANLVVHHGAARMWSEDDVVLLEETAERIWAAVERVRAEAALRESEERLQLALDASEMGTFLWHVEEDRGEPDEQMLALFGLPSDGTISLAEALATLIHPDDRAGYAEAISRATDPAGDGLLRADIRVVHADGSVRWLAITAQTSFEGEPRRAVRMSGVAVDITERKKAEEERERLLAHELTARAQTEERRRLSRELHDRVAHDMALVHQSLELHAALKESNPQRAEAKMQLARETVKEALHSTRNLSMQLRQQEVRGSLQAALAHLLRDLVPPDVRADLSVRGDEALVPPETRNQLFLILREAVRNAVAHSGCETVVVELSISEEMLVGHVEDDGRGFEAEKTKPGGGIRSMRERAALVGGDIEISRSPNGGTRVTVSAPLEEG